MVVVVVVVAVVVVVVVAEEEEEVVVVVVVPGRPSGTRCTEGPRPGPGAAPPRSCSLRPRSRSSVVMLINALQ